MSDVSSASPVHHHKEDDPGPSNIKRQRNAFFTRKKTKNHQRQTMSATTYQTNDNHLKEARLPLLMTDDETDVASDPRDDQNAFRRYALSLGLMVGTLMQLSILGANFLVISLWSPETLQTNMLGKIGLPILYSLVTPTMTLIALAYIRNLVSIAYQESRTKKKSEDASLQVLLQKLEGSFISGAISGICMVWVATPLTVVQRQLTPLVSYCIFSWFCDSSNDDDSNNDLEEDEHTTAEEGLYIRSSCGYRNAMVV
jgi:hypothetical protein